MERNLCLLIFFCCSLFASENFWFSYRVITEDKTVVYEERYISPHMTSLSEDLATVSCKTTIEKNKKQSTIMLLNENFDELLQCFYPMSSRLINRTLIENQGVREIIELTIVPIEFTVDFKDQFATIIILVP